MKTLLLRACKKCVNVTETLAAFYSSNKTKKPYGQKTQKTINKQWRWLQNLVNLQV